MRTASVSSRQSRCAVPVMTRRGRCQAQPTKLVLLLLCAQTTLSEAQAADFFQELEGTPAFAPTLRLMSSGPMVALAVAKPNAVQSLLELLGPADPAAARGAAPTSVRACWGTDATSNAAHASASASAARREVGLFFPNALPAELTTLIALPSPPTPGAPSSEEVASAAVKRARAAGFLLLGQTTVSLSAEQAASLAARRRLPTSPLSVASLTAGPLTVVALEKPKASEQLASLLLPPPVPSAAAAAAASDGSEPPGRQLVCAGSVSEAKAVAELFFGAAAVATPSTTFMCIPPHALHQSDEILARVEAAGFSILRASVLAPTTRQATELCAAPLSSSASSGGSGSAGGPRPSVDELTAGRALVGVLCRPFAISAGRSLVTPVGDGAPSASSVPLMPVVAVAERTVFSGAAGKPACYMSDSVESAAREAAIFFPELEQPQTTVAVLCPHATAHLDDLLSAASALGLRASRTHHTNWTAESAAAYLRTNLHSKPGSGSGEAALAAAASELSSGPCTLLELTGKGAVAKLAALLGPADPKKARVRCP